MTYKQFEIPLCDGSVDISPFPISSFIRHPSSLGSTSAPTKSRLDGATRTPTQERAYAMTDPVEYFAETTEAFFSSNGFFPFTRDELKRHDPEMHQRSRSCGALRTKSHGFLALMFRTSIRNGATGCRLWLIRSITNSFAIAVASSPNTRGFPVNRINPAATS